MRARARATPGNAGCLACGVLGIGEPWSQYPGSDAGFLREVTSDFLQQQWAARAGERDVAGVAGGSPGEHREDVKGPPGHSGETFQGLTYHMKKKIRQSQWNLNSLVW